MGLKEREEIKNNYIIQEYPNNILINSECSKKGKIFDIKR